MVQLKYDAALVMFTVSSSSRHTVCCLPSPPASLSRDLCARSSRRLPDNVCICSRSFRISCSFACSKAFSDAAIFSRKRDQSRQLTTATISLTIP